MNSLFDLSDNEVLEIYQRSVEEKVVAEFTEMVKDEMNRRGLILTLVKQP
ncbi:sporulation histidine kinase inhibitor Sda [Bacillus salacetis]|uniref:Sporulation histidine kinase inhibitor Sda n=1 Tax=Bacillus salacetis TaxID=2315464 RepID=A0A3A1QQG0_9BACI|nr:sporulation histidine kinase inhibitor Sda [Bacillus salacetis]RIW29100.1 sporulation histidine kinase inhibitor Sda [Bacillus salacetis]